MCSDKEWWGTHLTGDGIVLMIGVNGVHLNVGGHLVVQCSAYVINKFACSFGAMYHKRNLLGYKSTNVLISWYLVNYL